MLRLRQVEFLLLHLLECSINQLTNCISRIFSGTNSELDWSAGKDKDERITGVERVTGAEDEVFHGDLVAEGLTHLGDAEGDLHGHGALDVEELHKHGLGGFGTQVNRAFLDFALNQFGHFRLAEVGVAKAKSDYSAEQHQS